MARKVRREELEGMSIARRHFRHVAGSSYDDYDDLQNRREEFGVCSCPRFGTASAQLHFYEH